MPDFVRGDVLDLRQGIRLRAVDVSGTVGQVSARARADGKVRTGRTDALPGVLGAAERAGLRAEITVPLTRLTPRPGAPAQRVRGGRRGEPHLQLTVPVPAAGEGQVVVEVADSGLIRWHLPQAGTASAARTRAARTQDFRIPVVAGPAERPTSTRGVLGRGLRMLLQLVRYPVETVAGQAGKAAVGWWEDRHRPYSLDLLTADGDTAWTSPGRLQQLSDRPFLLLVHGTFTRGAAAFQDLLGDAAFMADVHRRYPGRILVFDHPTLHVDPDANVSWLLHRLPDQTPLTFDVLSHSRGGLVGRRLSSADLAGSAGRPTPVVRTLAHVATPNDGTLLASPDHWETLIDIVTNLLLLFPDTPAGVAVEGVLELVKQLGTGVLSGLDGLAAMDANGTWLAGLDPAEPGAERAVALTSNFQSQPGERLAVRALDLMADTFFGSHNDLVVPAEGVYRWAGDYRVSEHHLVPVSRGVAHTSFFADDEVRRMLARWLPDC